MEKQLFELSVTADRAPYLLTGLSGRVTSEPYKDGAFIKIKFLQELDAVDLLSIFHAGIQHGSESMARALRP